MFEHASALCILAGSRNKNVSDVFQNNIYTIQMTNMILILLVMKVEVGILHIEEDYG